VRTFKNKFCTKSIDFEYFLRKNAKISNYDILNIF